MPPTLSLPASACLIRPYKNTPSEARTLAHEANNPKIAKWMTNAFPHPYTLSDAEDWLRRASPGAESGVIAFAISTANSDTADNGTETETETLIGSIGLKPRTDIHHRTVELGYWLAEAHWGRGVATEAVRVFSGWVFRAPEFAHVVRIEAEVFEGNTGSQKVLEKAGYTLEARKRWAVEKGGVLLDVFLYVLLRDGEGKEITAN
ncbi:GNAT family N-acetyltransferase [Aspergillus lucknowensis]|uniref:Acyl-CoA N-acyltransferase n=1 Tax=Aspergillus lucknowensis TaxID=176173 RepID=A0ABR4M0J1_9EURO